MQRVEETSRPDDAEQELRIGEALVKEGLLSEAQLEQALAIQERRDPPATLGRILVEHGFLTRQQLNFILDWYYRKYRLGEILAESRIISRAQLDLALHHHRRTGLRLGEALRQLEFVTDEQLKRALCTQFGVTYVDLDKLAIDSGVAKLVDKEYAQLHRVVPIAQTEEGLTVAVADPADPAAVDELRVATGLRINVCTSTDAGFQRAFTRVYGESPEVALARQVQALGEAHDVLRREHGVAQAEIEDLRRRLAQVDAERRRTAEDMEQLLGRLRRLS